MNRNEAENLLWLYRPGTLDAADPEIREAMGLAASDPDLVRWLEGRVARHEAVRRQFRKIAAPAGLRQQIVSEHFAREEVLFRWHWPSLLAAAALVMVLIGLPFWFRAHQPAGAGLAVYQRQMAALALRGYGMEVFTNDPVPIRKYLAQNHAPADYVLPVALQQAGLAGCAIEDWRGAKVSMLCFRTGRPLASGAQSDLWLFVIDNASVPDAPAGLEPQFTKISRLTAALWRQGGKLYLLGTTADEATLRKFL